MEILYNINPETGLPHILDHGVTEEEVEELLETAVGAALAAYRRRRRRRFR